jgi:hypothetical protein
MSGYHDGSNLQLSGSVKDDEPFDLGGAFLEKPFTREGLLKKVRDILDSMT